MSGGPVDGGNLKYLRCGDHFGISLATQTHRVRLLNREVQSLRSLEKTVKNGMPSFRVQRGLEDHVCMLLH